MAEANIEALRATYAEWARGNFNTPDIFAEDIVTVWAEGFLDVGEHHGVDGLWESMRRMFESFDDMRIEAAEIHGDGERVLVLAYTRGRARSSGIPLDEAVSHVWTMRGGRAVRLEGFFGWDAGRRAVGLAE